MGLAGETGQGPETEAAERLDVRPAVRLLTSHRAPTTVGEATPAYTSGLLLACRRKSLRSKYPRQGSNL